MKLPGSLSPLALGSIAFVTVLSTVRGFSPTVRLSLASTPFVRSTRTRPPTSLGVSNPLRTERTQPVVSANTVSTLPETKPSSPSSVFGRPLDESTKQRNRQLVHQLKSVLFDQVYRGDTMDRAFARFYALETIARMPYFSYLSVLHLWETLGMWRRAEYLQVHFAESWNELHHLLIMEELGGNGRWGDRFVAQHIAFFYYWIVVTLYAVNPTMAYNLNQAVEEEAYETYDGFLQTHAEYLQSQPAPQAAVRYYTGDDLYLFHAMHWDTRQPKEPESPVEQRRPTCETLYDTIRNIRDDELEHVKTMACLQDESV
jgi:ubiquinol oxidase